MTALSREEFITHLEMVHGGLKDIAERLGTVEQDVAVLKDRSETLYTAAKTQAKTTASRWGMLLAGLGGMAELLHQWWGR